ncbi:FAD-dependent monooxygenase [Sphingobacterium bovistauri]|uniref:FAD-dependent monooxygenase n=1 Tax=Sphingobacterium bovistauri TaxID=2781959 RepID=A0ABS7ZBZ7_9SPHI|nr:FAD-dependent monooxygenase [Sphingobacterium bovistauri]MCA5006444.1 FAD-dependent monooxygenase [Sphingobacterium bovistauri]
MHIDTEFAIIGGGVAGLTAAIGLRQLGREFMVFEQAKVLKGIGAGFGLAANAMQALDILGLKEGVEKIGFYTNSFNILDQRGNILLAPDTKKLSQQYNQANFTIHRADLHFYLLNQLPIEKVTLGKKAIQFEQSADTITVCFDDGSTIKCKYLLIADGVKSPLRQQLLPSSTPRYSGYTCWRATIDNSSIQLDKGSETWGVKGRFGMTPLVGNRIYWYACVNSKANNHTFKNYTVKDLSQHFQHYHDPIPTILTETRNEDLIWNDIIDIKPLSHLAYGNVLLLGDAGHATTPNLGQGACQALEDIAVLMDELKGVNSVQDAFRNFEKRRLKRTKYITDTSKRIGEISQWDNPFLVSFRNTIMKLLPTKIAQSGLTQLLSVDFMKIGK